MPLSTPPGPRFYQFFHFAAAAYTLTPLTAGTVEPVAAPLARVMADCATATQMRLVVGQKIIGAGGTTCEARVQYATNGATQTTWADMNATGSGLNLLTGTANTLRDAGWVNIAGAARVDGLYLRWAVVITGTVTTAPTFSHAGVHFR